MNIERMAILMKYNIRGDKMEVTDAIGNYVLTKLDRLNKYFKDTDILANVLLRVDGNRQIIEVTIPTSKFILRGEEENEDLYAAIDLVTDKLERQIRKNKTRLNKQNVGSKITDFNFDYELEKDEETNDNEIVVKRKRLEMKPMDEEEAPAEEASEGEAVPAEKKAAKPRKKKTEAPAEDKKDAE